MRNGQIEAMFGGVLALFVLGIAIYAVANTNFGASKKAPTDVTTSTTRAPIISARGGQDLICECYNDAFEMAAKTKVVSPHYRTGFEQCRARAGVDGGDAWTAGWNARLSAKPYESSCRAYKRKK